ncbi:hypothetical protein P3T76_007599 [Phytophthora citrophthora]|uniref:Uncharacterized protein n=1 Tax=Phytophthora citrophthora TaxID=4793 RepID=A0AAD9GMK5_9STRA|nr:hypothetical protein P3T76_007599 [Phytophthora citrophthora]
MSRTRRVNLSQDIGPRRKAQRDDATDSTAASFTARKGYVDHHLGTIKRKLGYELRRLKGLKTASGRDRKTKSEIE